MTRSDVEDLLQGGLEDPDKKRAILKKARQRLAEQNLPDKNDRIRPRENVFISDKSFADSGEALIGVFLAKWVSTKDP